MSKKSQKKVLKKVNKRIFKNFFKDDWFVGYISGSDNHVGISAHSGGGERNAVAS